MNNSTHINDSKSYTVEILIFLTYAFFSANWVVGSNLSPEIIAAFGIHGSSTAIQNSVTISKIIGNLVASSILVRLNPKKSIGLGSLLIAAGCLIAAFAPTFTIFIIGRFIMGFGGALYVVYFAPIALQYFSDARRPTINAINNVAYNMGGVIALLTLTPVHRLTESHRGTLLVYALISLILWVFWQFVGEDFELVGQGANRAGLSLKDGMKEKLSWAMAFTFSGRLLLYMVMLNMFPNTGLSAIPASRVSLLFTIGGIFGTMLFIYLGRFTRKRLPTIKICGSLLPILGIILVESKSIGVTTLISILLGIVMYIPMTSLMSIPQEMPNMNKALVTQIMSVFWSVTYFIETIAYFIVGQVQYAFGDKAAIYLSIILSLSFVIGAFLLPEPTDEKARTYANIR